MDAEVLERNYSLFGLCVTPESTTEPSHSLGVILLYGDPRAVSLSQFRKSICSNEYGIRSSDLPPEFCFLTEQGFPICQDIESNVMVADVGTKSGQIRIRVYYRSGRKIGVKIHENSLNNKARSVGFVFCNVAETLDAFRKKMNEQLSHLPDALLKGGVILDHNLWPVTPEQEQVLRVFEAILSGEINMKISTHGQGANVSEQNVWKPSQVPMDPLIHTMTSNKALHSASTSRPNREGGRSRRTSQSSCEVDTVEVATLSAALPITQQQCDIVISYVRVEAFQFATELKLELLKLGFSVFLDADEIPFGSDWQDVLNGAINSCYLFVALVTPRYGETMWTNREVKLADILGKKIVPINFTSSWPPLCLAIQFATTQFIPWKKKADDLDSQAMKWVASEIHSKHGGEIILQHPDSGDNVDGCASSLCEEIDGETTAVSLKVPNVSKKPSLRSCPTVLPKEASPEFVKMLRQPREGRDLVMIISDTHHIDLRQKTTAYLESLSYDVYIPPESSIACNEKITEFASKVDEAGAVVVIISEELLSCESCRQQIFYCEQRKLIVPVIVGNVQLPLWLGSLIGTREFVQAASSSYKEALKEYVAKALVPVSSEEEWKERKSNVDRINMLKQDLQQKLPSKGKLVYFSGGTKFFSTIGEAVCKEIGTQLAQHQDVVLVTGGFFGVGDTVARSFFEERQKLDFLPNVYHVQAVRDAQDKSAQTRQNKDGTFQKVPYGGTVFVGDSVRERETLIATVLRTCILIEGGPGAAYEVEQFSWNGGVVVPVKVTGGAAGGGFNVPSSVLACPPRVQKEDWDLLGDTIATPTQIAQAVVRIVLEVTSDCGASFRPSISTSSCSGDVAIDDKENDRKRPWSLANSITEILP